jgi:putative transposase
MRKRRTADEVARVLRDVDRDLAKGLTIADVCRKIGIAQTTYYRWRERHDPAQVDADRRCRELETEVERLKRLVAELMLDKQMLQDIAKKSGERRPAAGGGGLPGRALRRFAAAGLPHHGAISLDVEVSPESSKRRTGADPRDQTIGASVPAVRISADSRDAWPRGLGSEPETSAAARDRTGASAARETEKTAETRRQAGGQRQ